PIRRIVAQARFLTHAGRRGRPGGWSGPSTTAPTAASKPGGTSPLNRQGSLSGGGPLAKPSAEDTAGPLAVPAAPRSPPLPPGLLPDSPAADAHPRSPIWSLRGSHVHTRRPTEQSHKDQRGSEFPCTASTAVDIVILLPEIAYSS